MILINGTHDFYEMKEYAFNVLPKYSINREHSSTLKKLVILFSRLVHYFFSENKFIRSFYQQICFSVYQLTS